MCASGPDYLAYALIGTIIDGYYPILERIGDHLEELEERALTGPGRATLREIYDTKRQLLNVRRAVWLYLSTVSMRTNDVMKVLTIAAADGEHWGRDAVPLLEARVDWRR